MGVLACVFILKADYRIAFWAVELDSHCLIQIKNQKLKCKIEEVIAAKRRFHNFDICFLIFDILLLLLHKVGKSFQIVGPFFRFEQVNFILFDKHCQVLFHSEHLFVRLILCFGLQL